MNFKLLVPLKNVNKITCKSTANHWVWSGTPGIWWTILVDFAIQDFKPFLLTQRAHSHTYSAVFVVVLAAYSNGLTSNSFFFFSPPSMHPALIGALPFFQNEYDHIYHSLFVAQSFSVQTMQILNIQRKLQESFLWLTVVFFDETLSHPATSLKTNLKPKPTHNMLDVNLTAIQKKAKQNKQTNKKNPPPSVCWHSGVFAWKAFYANLNMMPEKAEMPVRNYVQSLQALH